MKTEELVELQAERMALEEKLRHHARMRNLLMSRKIQFVRASEEKYVPDRVKERRREEEAKTDIEIEAEKEAHHILIERITQSKRTAGADREDREKKALGRSRDLRAGRTDVRRSDPAAHDKRSQ